MGADEGAQPVAGFGGLLAQGAAGGDLVPGEASPGGRHLGQDLGVTVQKLVGKFPFCHAVPLILDAPVTVS